MKMAEKEIHLDYTDVLTWASLIILILWIIGRLIGLIQSPAWVELVPFITIAGAIMGMSLKAGIVLQKIDTIAHDTVEIKDELKDHERRITILEK